MRGFHGERGSIYILVLGTSLLVAAAGVAAVGISRAGTRSAAMDRDATEAATAAAAGVEMLLAQLNETPAWRTVLKSGGTIGPVTIGRARVVLTVVDEEDGSLADDPSDSVRLYAAARVRGASRVQSVRAEPQGSVGLDVLRSAVHAAGSVTVSKDVAVVGGPVSSGSSVSNSATLAGSVEAPAVSSTGFIDGRVTVGPAKAMPTTAGWDALAAAATPISSGSIGGKIDKDVLGPGVNTAGGGTNARGIYLVTVPLGGTLTISRSRINACLLVDLGPGATLATDRENYFDAPDPRLPTLLVRGGLLASVDLKMAAGAQLKESDAGRTLNPPGCPYLGVTDGDKSDTYPNAITGLVHVLTPTAVRLGKDLNLAGCLITAGSLTIDQDHITAAAQPSLLSSPPTGYADPSKTTMRMVPGTVRWEVGG